MHARLTALVEIHVAGILRDLAAAAAAADDRRFFAEVRSELDARIGDGFAGGNHRELREAVEMIGATALEIFRGIVIAHFGAVLEAQKGRINGSYWADGGDAAAYRGPRIGHI